MCSESKWGTESCSFICWRQKRAERKKKRSFSKSHRPLPRVCVCLLLCRSHLHTAINHLLHLIETVNFPTPGQLTPATAFTWQSSPGQSHKDTWSHLSTVSTKAHISENTHSLTKACVCIEDSDWNGEQVDAHRINLYASISSSSFSFCSLSVSTDEMTVDSALKSK